MFGFVFGWNCASYKSVELQDAKEYRGDDFFCKYKMMNKFENDRLIFDSENIFCIMDGVIFNKCELMKKNGNKTWKDTFIDFINMKDNECFTMLRGSFCGVIYRKKEHRITVFTNLLGEKAVYYYNQDYKLIVTSHMILMKEAFEKYSFKMQPNIQGCYEMLTTGTFLHGNTFLKDVRKLMGGKLLIVQNGLASEQRYHMFRNVPEWNLSLKECIDEADSLFRQAVKRICDKNREYGYDIEADLSGGLDSRLATWVAHDFWNKNRRFINACWCQRGKIDHISSKQIAKKLGNDYIFYAMDGGDFLKEVDKRVKITGGQIVYIANTCSDKVLNSLDLSNIGMSLTGLLGESHNAYWTEGIVHTEPKYFESRYTDLVGLNLPDSYAKEYDNYEQMNLYELSSLNFLSSVFTRQDSVEVCSPYIDKDFLEFVYKIPLQWRKNYYFTMNWMVEKYPDAAKFVWQHAMKPVDKELNNRLYLPKILWDAEKTGIRIYNKICREFHIQSQAVFRNDMNPIDKWYITNRSIRKYFVQYYRDNRHYVRNKKLYEDLKLMMKSGKGYDAMLVVNLLAIFKLYSGN